MSSVPVFVGLDYHQDSVQVCVLNADGKVLTNRSVTNDATLIQWLSTVHGEPQRHGPAFQFAYQRRAVTILFPILAIKQTLGGSCVAHTD